MNAQVEYQKRLGERVSRIRGLLNGNMYRQYIENEFGRAFDDLTAFYEKSGLSKTLKDGITPRARVVSDVGIGALGA